MQAAGANAAIQYQPDDFDAFRPLVMGRHTASAGFLSGFVAHADVDAHYCFTQLRKDFGTFQQQVERMPGPRRPSHWRSPAELPALKEPGCLHLAGPGLGHIAWRRRFTGERAFSLTGVTHTIASDRVLDSLAELLTAPVQPWDALICTSRSVKAAVERIHEVYGDYLRDRMQATPVNPAQLAVIPLGVNCDAFAPGPEKQAQRDDLRARLGIGAEDVAVLFFGRLSFHAKAHPVPMYMALQQAMRGLPKGRLHLLMLGQFPNAEIEAQFKEAVPRHCPDVPVHFLDGADVPLSAAAWAAADVFTSLSDNIQESFGLTVIEAMASGLPCVVSDWDGYRDTVADRETGFRVPTLTPSGGVGTDLAERYFANFDSYDRYIGHVSQTTAVDIAACAEAFHALASDPALRRAMGEAGRQRARRMYDWRVVIGQYQELWAELAARRQVAPALAPAEPHKARHPVRDDPYSTFAGHPTRVIGGAMRVRAAPNALETLALVEQGSLNTFSSAVLLAPQQTRLLLEQVAGGARVVGELIRPLTPRDRRTVLRTLAWLKKYGLVDIDG